MKEIQLSDQERMARAKEKEHQEKANKLMNKVTDKANEAATQTGEMLQNKYNIPHIIDCIYNTIKTIN